MQTTGIGAAFAAELEIEAQNTRKLLERLAPEHFAYTPHPKSWDVAHLTGHLADMPGWVPAIMAHAEFTLPHDYRPFVPAEPAELLRVFDANSRAAAEALRAAPDAAFAEEWRLLVEGRAMIAMPRQQVIRGIILSHSIHHRGQLTVYARLCGVPLPAIYGSSADDPGALG